jgi:hypothetical protein
MGEKLFGPESWEISHAYARQVGDIPASFSGLVRGLQTDANGDGTLSDASKTQLRLLLKSDNFRAAYYFAARLVFRDELAEKDRLNPRELASLFQAKDLIPILAMIYLYRRQRNLCDKEKFEEFNRQTMKSGSVGLLVGRSLTNIGMGTAALAASLRYLGANCFLKHDQEGFHRYRNRCELNKVTFDSEYEHERWKCTSLQVGAYLIQGFGYSGRFGQDFTQALREDRALSDITNQDEYKFKIAEVWVNSFLSTGREPQIKHQGDYYPLKEERDRLESEITWLLKDEPEMQRWLSRSKDELNQENAPHFFDIPVDTAEEDDDEDGQSAAELDEELS